MSWHIDSYNRVLDRIAATDADEDMAFALSVADKKWGGYSSDAKSLNVLMKREVEANTYGIKPGDS